MKLPYDIRHMIWEEAIFTPGIHFLKFVEAPRARAPHTPVSTVVNSGESLLRPPERRAEGTQDAENPVYSATLKPIFPFACADNSHYITMHKTLARLRESCDEANFLVEKVVAQPGNLTLGDGKLVLLQRSSDVVCIEYPGMVHARYLGRWAEHLDTSQLANVRRLAVRYHHEWDNEQAVCAYCGRMHLYHGKHAYPRHVFEFAALFKNLEAFYFIDYLTVRKPPHSSCQPHQVKDAGKPGERFASGGVGRTYFEADPESCTAHTRVHETLSWVRNSYLAHCKRKSLGPSQPQNVSFKVLACEWDADQTLAPAKRPAAQVAPKRRRRTRTYPRTRTTSALASSSASSASIAQSAQSSSSSSTNAASVMPTDTNPLPVVFGDGGKSKFNFSLEIPH